MISTPDLQEWMKADDADALTLRRLEESAIAAIQKQTGRYLGVTVAAFVEIVRFRGWPLQLSNQPTGGVITTLEVWDGSAWSAVAATDYYVSGSFVWPNATSAVPTTTIPAASRRYRATYPAGYTVDANDADVWAAPADIQMLVLLLVGHWFENRESVVVGTSAAEIPQGLQMLMEPHRLASV